MIEIWKDIGGFEGFYQVSNNGNIRSVDRVQINSKGVAVHYNGKRMKPIPNSSGYLRVELKSKNKKERWFVHRLVATHFVDNEHPEVNIVVNHIDSNFLNNNAANLEWTTHVGNAQHALKAGRMKRTQKWLDNLHRAQEKSYTPVIGYNPINGETVVFFKSINECGRSGYEASCVCDCCKGKRRTHRGLAWKYGKADNNG